MVELVPPGGVAPTRPAEPQQRAPRAGAGRPRRPRPRAGGRGLFAPPERSTRGRSRRARQRRRCSRPRSRCCASAASRPATSGCSARSSSGSTGPASSAGSSPARDRRRIQPMTRARPERPIVRRRGTTTTSRPAFDAARACSARCHAPARPISEPAGSEPPRPRGRGPVMRTRVFGKPPVPRDPVERVLALVTDELTGRTSAASRDRARALVARRPDGPRGRRRSRSPTASSGPSTACCPPPARSPRARSSSAWRRCSRVTTCRTRRSSAHASRATAARPPPRAGSSPPRTSGAAPPSTPSCSRSSPTPATSSGSASGSAGATRRGGSAIGPSATSSIRIGSASPGSRPVSLVPKEDGEAVDCIWYQRGVVRAPVRGRVDGDARRRPASPPRPHPAGRADRPLPRPRARAARARAPQARVVAAAARRDRDVELARDPVAAPPGLAGARAARPRRPRAVPRPRPARSSGGPSSSACSRPNALP